MKISPVYAFQFIKSFQVYSHLSLDHQSVLEMPGGLRHVGLCRTGGSLKENVGLDTPSPQGLSYPHERG